MAAWMALTLTPRKKGHNGTDRGSVQRPHIIHRCRDEWVLSFVHLFVDCERLLEELERLLVVSL